LSARRDGGDAASPRIRVMFDIRWNIDAAKC
jgi:hypothetical protein